MSVNYSNIKLLFFMSNSKYIDIKYIFLIREDKYHYMLLSFDSNRLYSNLYTLNKITQDLEFKKENIYSVKKLHKIIKESKNVEEYNYPDIFDHENIIIKYSITHIRKFKIENICQ